jgi:pimeloyl-ACP methyl ester carboxylesterase
MLDLARQSFEGADVNGYEILLGFSLGGAALALWLLIRFPDAGPRRPATMIAALLAVGLLLRVTSPIFAALVGVGGLAVPLALLGIVLPCLTLAFWVSGCLLRALADLSRLLR